MLTNSEKKYIISEIQKEQFQENDHIDFKLQWYEKNAALVQDLLSFANTFHHDNCYIVIGIEDDTKEIVGIDNNDKNRKNTQQLIDLIGGLHLAQNSFFSVEVDHLEINEKILDVIIIENSDNTPFFLSKDYGKLKKGLVYCRRKDTNTSNEKIATDKEIENLYKKRLHLDQDILTQFKYLLQDFDNWDRCETIHHITVIFHKLQPDFYIKIRPAKRYDRVLFDAFSINEIRPEITYHKLELCFHSIKLKTFTLVGLDDGRKKLIWPKSSYKNVNHGYYYYEYIDSIEYHITRLLNNKSKENPYGGIVLYKNEEERKRIERSVKVDISDEDIFQKIDTIKFNLKQIKKIRTVDSYELQQIVKAYLTAKKLTLEIKNHNI